MPMLLQVLFDLARYHAPSTVFLDEIDALMGARGEAGEHEASRRMKTELLIQVGLLWVLTPITGDHASCPGSFHADSATSAVVLCGLPWAQLCS
jgi:hypothetical protein